MEKAIAGLEGIPSFTSSQTSACTRTNLEAPEFAPARGGAWAWAAQAQLNGNNHTAKAKQHLRTNGFLLPASCLRAPF